ncbi:MAG: phosphomannomutase/phosphoglucomutase [bacterium]
MQIVNKINPEIFRGYDLRGVSGVDLSEDVMYTLGCSYGAMLQQRRIKESAVGCDNRLTSISYKKAFIQGLNDVGIDTIDLGYSLSQIVYYSSYHFLTKGGAMITASHNPGDFNGLKLSLGYSDTMITEEIQQLRNNIDTGKYFISDKKGSNREEDIFPSYQKNLLKHFSLKKKWKVIVEACNTTSGMFYPKLLETAGCEVITQNCELDGNFPLGAPDPTESEVLKRVAERVLKEKADIGFAYDADGDRMSAVDENGRILWMDSVVAIFAKDVLDYMPGSKIVYNTLCSRQVTEAIEQAGGIPIMCLTGHSFVKATVKEERAPFGGELSGHIFFMDNFYGHDDAAYASLRLLQYLERKNQKLSEAMDALSIYVSSPEIKFGLADAIKFQLIDNEIKSDFKQTWQSAEFTEIEGIRMDTKDSMAIVRASQNGPYITVKFEGRTQDIYDQVKVQVREILKKYSQIDWSKGVNTHALD